MEQLASFVVETGLGLANQQLLDVGQELVQRRVEQADGDGQAIHRLEDPLEVGALELLELVERGFLLGRVVGQDEALHQREPVAQEHVLGAAEPDALGTEAARHVGVVRQVGVGPHLHATEAVSPLEDGVERATRLGSDDRDRADHHLAGRAVDRDDVALVDHRTVHVDDAALDVDRRARSRHTPPGVPMPRATTAAWLTRPPRDVRMPSAAIMPCRSSGEVSGRTRMTASPASWCASAASAVK